MDDLLTFAGLAALGVQVTAIIKYLSNAQVRQAVTAVLPWLGLFVVLILAGQADATSAIAVPGLDTTLGALDIASAALVAMSVGSAGSVALVDFRKAVDSSDTAAQPGLMVHRGAPR